MDVVEINVFEIDDVTNDQLLELIKAHESFEIKGINRLDFFRAVEKVESLIEGEGLSCRVYTTYRSTSMLAAAMSNPVTAIAGLASVVGIAAHNVATWNPDYELGKNLTLGRLEVTYKK